MSNPGMSHFAEVETTGEKIAETYVDASVHFNPLMMRDNANAEAGDVGETIGTADDDGWQDSGLEIHYSEDGFAYSYNPVTGETAWLDN